MVKKSFLIFSSLIFLFLIVFSSFVSAIPVILSDQGTDVRDISTGNLLTSGHLTVQVWDSASGGTKIYEQYFTNAIINGSWNVMLNNSLDLEYGKTYYKDYLINGDNLVFDGNDRLEFMSPLGLINNISKINFSIISSCASGSAIRKINEDGTVTCESVGGGSGGGWTNDSSGIYSTLNVSVTGNLSVSDSGFFNYLGSLVSRITKLFVQDVDILNNVSVGGNLSVSGQTFVTGNLTTNEGIVANYFCNSTNCYTIADFLTSSGVSTYNATYALWAYNQTGSASAYDYNHTSAVEGLYGMYFYNMSDGSYNATYDKWAYNQSDSIWHYNQTYSGSIYNATYESTYNATYESTYNATYALWAYNETYSGSTYNETYALWAYNQTISSEYNYNQTQPFTDWLSTFLYNYNQTYSGSTYNTTYESTYNETYALWAYNQTGIGANVINGTLLDITNITNFNYNYNQTYSGSTYNVSYESTYNATYESTYNATYESTYNTTYESTFNATYALWAYNMTGSASAYDYNHTSAVEGLYGMYFYNMSDGSYNATYALWAYNQSDSIWHYNQTDAAVPYTGAAKDVNLGVNNFTTKGILTIGQDYEQQIIPVNVLINGTSFFNSNVFNTNYVEIIPGEASLGVGTYFNTPVFQASTNPISILYGNNFATSTLENGGDYEGMWLSSIKSTSTINANSEVDKIYGVDSTLSIAGNVSDSAFSFYAGKDVTGIVNNLYGLYIEDFSKGTLEGDGATIGTNSYAIYSAGGDVYLDKTDLTVVGDTNITENLRIEGNLSVKRPYWNGYDNSTQVFANTANVQVINISNNVDYDSYGIHVVGNQNLTFDQTGDYLCVLSPEFYQAAGTNKIITFWFQKNGVDVAWSNSRYTIVNGQYFAPSITYQFDIHNPLTDNIRFMWYSDSTATQIVSISGLTSPTRPAIPGILLNCQKVSETT